VKRWSDIAGRAGLGLNASWAVRVLTRLGWTSSRTNFLLLKVPARGGHQCSGDPVARTRNGQRVYPEPIRWTSYFQSAWLPACRMEIAHSWRRSREAETAARTYAEAAAGAA
jgi:hypothetical protein